MGRFATQVYNNRGLLASSTNMAGQVTTLDYDAKGRLTNRTDNIGSTAYGYDVSDNLTNVSASDGKANAWTYDAYNRVTSYRDGVSSLPGTHVIKYVYDGNGNLTNLVYPDGKVVRYAYDSLNRMTSVTDWNGRVTTYSYDMANHLTKMTRPNGTVRMLSYDTAGQCTNILEQTALWPIALQRFGWNASGTMDWEFVAPLPHSNSVPKRTMTYDSDNRLTGVSGQAVASDGNGNLTISPMPDGTLVNCAFDSRNRLGITSIGLFGNSIQYQYDALNNRTYMSYAGSIATYAVNPNASLSQVLMRTRNGMNTWYVYGHGLLYEVEQNNTTRTYHYDCRGSTIAITDDNGNVTDRVEYSAYGLTTYRTGNTDTPFLFNGYYGVQTDPNGLLYMRARYYNPWICRFMNADPSGFSGGLNWYAYASGNPVSMIDPFGLWGIQFGVNGYNFGSGNPTYVFTLSDLNAVARANISNPLGSMMSSTVDYLAGANGRYAAASQNFRTGGGNPINVDPNTLNFSGLQGGQKYYTFPYSGIGDFIVHGTVTLIPSADGSQLNVNDRFDFDVGAPNHPWNSLNQDIRNIETLGAHFITDPLDAITDPSGNGTGSANISGNGGFPFNFTDTINNPGSQSSLK